MAQQTKKKRRTTSKPQRAIRAILYLEDQTKLEGETWEITGVQKMDLGKVIWDFNTEKSFQQTKRSIAHELLPVFVEMITSRSQDLSACIRESVNFPGWMNRAIPE